MPTTLFLVNEMMGEPELPPSESTSLTKDCDAVRRTFALPPIFTGSPAECPIM